MMHLASQCIIMHHYYISHVDIYTCRHSYKWTCGLNPEREPQQELRDGRLSVSGCDLEQGPVAIAGHQLLM